ncbi:MAG: 50S ribosomal protein L13 [Nanoarchaeota archaeon]|nr:50S ribosomal protein L13 [Nanoarchaeota archaeon]
MIIDGNNLILGRVATFAAKKALLGEKVDIINCENIVITGNKKDIIAKYKRKKTMGVPSKGPFQPKKPDMFVRKIIRGMLPYKQPRGRDAFEKIKCYFGVPGSLKEKAATIKTAEVDKVPNLNYITVGKVCEVLGWQRK